MAPRGVQRSTPPRPEPEPRVSRVSRFFSGLNMRWKKCLKEQFYFYFLLLEFAFLSVKKIPRITVIDFIKKFLILVYIFLFSICHQLLLVSVHTWSSWVKYVLCDEGLRYSQISHSLCIAGVDSRTVSIRLVLLPASMDCINSRMVWDNFSFTQHSVYRFLFSMHCINKNMLYSTAPCMYWL